MHVLRKINYVFNMRTFQHIYKSPTFPAQRSRFHCEDGFLGLVACQPFCAAIIRVEFSSTNHPVIVFTELMFTLVTVNVNHRDV